MVIPVVFATDENYIPYMGVALHSLIRHTSPEYEYRVYILAGSVTSTGKKRILGMRTDNVQIEIVDMAAYFASLDIPKIGHFSKEVAGRLLIAQLFPQYEKVLYLDCDIIVNRDVAELYQTDIQGYILGAVLDMPDHSLYRHIKEDLGLSAEAYFNSGVLLLNLPLFRQYGIGKRALSMLNTGKYPWPDQDALNLLCKDRVKYLDGRWNVLWGYINCPDSIPPEIASARGNVFSRYESPYIIHYTFGRKPWTYPEWELAEYFWENARETVFYEQILFQNIRAMKEASDSFARFLFPWRLIMPGSRIILYGGGDVGKAFLCQNEKTGYCHICVICDRNPSGVGELPVPVIGINELSRYTYDKILIAVEKESIAEEIKADLLAKGVPEAKIEWTPPGRK